MSVIADTFRITFSSTERDPAVGSVKIGAGLTGTQTIVLDGQKVADYYRDIDAALRDGKSKGIWIEFEARPADEEIELEYSGAGLTWTG